MLAALKNRKALKKTAPPKDKTKRPPKDVKGVYYWFNSVEGAFEPTQWTDQKDLMNSLFSKEDVRCVLVDFFAYSCTNCIRTIPVLKSLHEKYHKHGLRIVAFHRPEFAFEHDAFNMVDFIKRSNIEYMVGLDNEDKAWNAWGVEFWPQHFVVTRDGDNKLKISYSHFGDRNHHNLEQHIVNNLLKGANNPKIAPMNHEVYYDAEIFLGKGHRAKNTSASGSHCDEGACKIQTKGSIGFEGKMAKRDDKKTFTVYGAAWCKYCRTAKLLLKALNVSFDFIDMDAFGGPKAVRNYLINTEKSIPETHTTIPIIFNEGKFIGGFTDLETLLRENGTLKDDSVLEKVQKQVNESLIEFNKPRTAATIKVDDTSMWDTNDECMIAKCDNASFNVQFNMESDGANVTMFIVGEPPKKKETSEAHEALYAKQKQGASSVIFNNDNTISMDGSPYECKGNTFEAKTIVCKQNDVDDVKVPLSFADRHFVYTFKNKNTSIKSCVGECKLYFESGSRIYVVYLTSEPYTK